MITKQRPQSGAGIFVEMFSNADNYTIEFNPQGNLTAEQKATILAGQLLADYMFFDGNTEKCNSDDSGVTCYFWYCSIIGAIIPCCIYIPKSK